ncbi:hypothetical protein Ciccas_011055, partial [Cichlidogyrus casuarinus]
METFLYFCPGSQQAIETADGFNLANVTDRHFFYLYHTRYGHLTAEASNSYVDRQRLLFSFANPQDPNVGLVDAQQWANVCVPYPTSIYMGSSQARTKIFNKLIIFSGFLIILLNSITCYVLTRKHMRTPTHLILFSITLAQMFANIVTVPIHLAKELISDPMWWTSFLAHKPENTENKVGYGDVGQQFYKHRQMCDSNAVAMAIYLMEYLLPSLAHGAVIWLTIVMAAQRYVYITFPTDTSRWCSIRSSVYASIGAVLVALLIHIPPMSAIFVNFKPVIYIKSQTQSPVACHKSVESLLAAMRSVPGQVAKCNNNRAMMIHFHRYLRTLTTH